MLASKFTLSMINSIPDHTFELNPETQMYEQVSLKGVSIE